MSPRDPPRPKSIRVLVRAFCAGCFVISLGFPIVANAGRGAEDGAVESTEDTLSRIFDSAVQISKATSSLEAHSYLVSLEGALQLTPNKEIAYWLFRGSLAEALDLSLDELSTCSEKPVRIAANQKFEGGTYSNLLKSVEDILREGRNKFAREILRNLTEEVPLPACYEELYQCLAFLEADYASLSTRLNTRIERRLGVTPRMRLIDEKSNYYHESVQEADKSIKEVQKSLEEIQAASDEEIRWEDLVSIELQSMLREVGPVSLLISKSARNRLDFFHSNPSPA